MITSEDLKLLNSEQILKDNLDKYIEAFVTLYGEDRREEITSKLKDLIIIAYQKPEERKTIINDIAMAKSKIAYNNFLKKHGFSEENIDADIFKKIFGNIDIDRKLFNYNDFKDYINYFNQGEEERLMEFYKDGWEYYQNWVDETATLDEYIEFVKTGKTKVGDKKFPSFVINNLKFYRDISHAEDNIKRKRKYAVKFLENLGYSTSVETIDEDYKAGMFHRITALIDDEESLFESYKEVTDTLAPYKAEIKEYEDKEKEIEKEYEKKFYKDISVFFTEEEKEIVEEAFASSYFSSYKITDTVSFKTLIGSSYTDTPLIEYFSKEYEEKLKDESFPSFAKTDILNKRIKYFKLKGIDLGDDYSAYENSIEAYAVYPSYEFIDEVCKVFYGNKNEKNIELFNAYPYNREKQKEIESRGCLDKEHAFNASLYTSTPTCVNPNLTIGENGLKPCNMVFIHVTDNDALDHLIAHELNHVVELSLVSATDKDYLMVSGWDYCDGKILQSTVEDIDTVNKDNRDKRSYELINEIVNELLAQRVSHIMEEQGSYVFCSSERNRITGATGYEKTFFLIRDFLEEYKDEIIASRKDNNIEVLFNKVGKENFDKLAALFIEFENSFPGLAWVNYVLATHEGKEHPAQAKVDEIVAKRDAILESMREYSLSSKKL